MDFSLHPDHLTDLRKSGLTDETIKQAGIYSVRPADIPKKLGFDNPEIQTAMAIPYGNDFERIKIFPSLNGMKYVQRKGSKSHLYINNQIKNELADSKISIYITEGEKKTLKGIQEGLVVLGLGGLWNWSDGSEEKKLIPDFDSIVWDGRTVFLIPDNDWELSDRQGERRNLPGAVYELSYRLIDRGSKVYIVELPQGPEKGLDDYLCRHIVDEFKVLPKREVRKQTVQEMIQEASLQTLPEILKRLSRLKETERAVFISALSKKLDIPKMAIRKDLKSAKSEKSEGAEILTTAYFSDLVELGIDENGEIAFLKLQNGELAVSKVEEIAGELYKPPDKTKIPFLLPKIENVLTWALTDKDEVLFNDLLNHLKKFSYIPDHQFIFTALFTFSTYIQDHSDIRYLPMLLFWSVPERGKSRSGKAVAYCSYRGIHVVDLREANLFRYSQDYRATIFIDIMNLWKKAERNASEDVLLLRYEKGATVARVLNPDKGPFKDMTFFDVYGPTVLATNEPVHHILDTRCLPVSMPNKPRDYENPTPEKSREIRERLTAWRVRAMSKPLPIIETIPGITGRLWDISRPLFQICKMVCPVYEEVLKLAILEIAGERTEEKSETLEGQIVEKIKDLSGDVGILSEWPIELQDIVDRLNEKRPDKFKLTPEYIGRRVKALGLKKVRTNKGRLVRVTRVILDALLVQFGFEDIPPLSVPQFVTTDTTDTNLINSTGCAMSVPMSDQNRHQSDMASDMVKNKDISMPYAGSDGSDGSTHGQGDIFKYDGIEFQEEEDAD